MLCDEKKMNKKQTYLKLHHDGIQEREETKQLCWFRKSPVFLPVFLFKSADN